VKGVKLQGYSWDCLRTEDPNENIRYAATPTKVYIEYNDGCRWYRTNNHGQTWKPKEDVPDDLQTVFLGPNDFFSVKEISDFSPFLAKQVRIIFKEYEA
jgi:hypothetical protein